MNKTLINIALTGVMASALFAAPQTNYKNQQGRIANGVRSGQLTPGETAHLENRQRAINGEARADRNANGGKLTAGERARVNGQRANTSRQIYADKHNASQDHFGNSKVGVRDANQQRRIANGIQSGKLNANEATHVEGREAGVNREVRTDRAVNGGSLTPGERQQVNGQQNRISKNIYNDKHN
jgi:hypothetical protein